jgi:hypothetical protein
MHDDPLVKAVLGRFPDAEILPPQSVTFQMTSFIWEECGMYVFKDGMVKLDIDNLVPDQPIKVMVLGEEPNEAQVETVKAICWLLSQYFRVDTAAFCPAISSKM